MSSAEVDSSGTGSQILSLWLGKAKPLKASRSTAKLLDDELAESPRTTEEVDDVTCDGGTAAGQKIAASWPKKEGTGVAMRVASLIDLDQHAEEVSPFSAPASSWEDFDSEASAFKKEPDFDVESVASSVRCLSVSTHQRTQSSESIAMRYPLSRATSGHPFSDTASIASATPAASVHSMTRPALMRPLRTMQSLPAKWANSDASCYGVPDTPYSTSTDFSSSSSLPARYSGPLPDAWFAPRLAEVPVLTRSMSRSQAILDGTWSAAAANVDPCAEEVINAFAEYSKDMVPPPRKQSSMKPQWLAPWAEGAVPEGDESCEDARA